MQTNHKQIKLPIAPNQLFYVFIRDLDDQTLKLISSNKISPEGQKEALVQVNTLDEQTPKLGLFSLSLEIALPDHSCSKSLRKCRGPNCLRNRSGYLPGQFWSRHDWLRDRSWNNPLVLASTWILVCKFSRINPRYYENDDGVGVSNEVQEALKKMENWRVSHVPFTRMNNSEEISHFLAMFFAKFRIPLACMTQQCWKQKLISYYFFKRGRQKEEKSPLTSAADYHTLGKMGLWRWRYGGKVKCPKSCPSLSLIWSLLSPRVRLGVIDKRERSCIKLEKDHADYSNSLYPRSCSCWAFHDDAI